MCICCFKKHNKNVTSFVTSLRKTGVDKMKNRKNKHDEDDILLTPSSTPIFGHPETAIEMINKFGTYEIQPTADTENLFPAISQGLKKNGYKGNNDNNNKVKK